jgi:hypothetical protein
MKARFKTIVLSALSALTVFTAVTYTSCNEDKCKSIVCAHGGVCTDGACLCPTGYEGPQCETVNRKRYLGNWRVTENGSITDAAQYTISVEEGDNITELKLKNFRNLLNTRVTAYVKGDTLYIPQQVVNNNTVQGSGYLLFDKFYGRYGQLVVRYKVTDAENNVDDFGVDSGDASLWNK